MKKTIFTIIGGILFVALFIYGVEKYQDYKHEVYVAEHGEEYVVDNSKVKEESNDGRKILEEEKQYIELAVNEDYDALFSQTEGKVNELQQDYYNLALAFKRYKEVELKEKSATSDYFGSISLDYYSIGELIEEVKYIPNELIEKVNKLYDIANVKRKYWADKKDGKNPQIAEVSGQMKEQKVESESDYSSKNEYYSGSDNNYTSNETTTYIEPLIIEETSCIKDGNYSYAKGYVKNQSDQTLSFIQVNADFIDSTGNVIDTDYTYAAGAEGLAPNSRKSFEIMIPTHESMGKCRSKIVDYQ